MQCLTKIPYVDLGGQHTLIKEEILKAIEKVLVKGQFILGEEVREFERSFAELCGSKFVVGVNSGTDALIMALRVLGIGKGDEVITVANSYITTASCIVCAGATPVFIDVKSDYTMDPALLEGAITKNTKAIIPVHLTGRPADMQAILEITKKYNLHVIEDAAQAVCTEYNGKRVGSFGDIGCFSFHPLKTLNACGDSGALVTDNQELYEKSVLLRNSGIYGRNYCGAWSSNSRLDTLQAAILLVKMKYIYQWTQSRRENAKIYQEILGGIDQVQFPVDRAHEKSVYHTFVIQADDRDRLQNYLEEQGVGTRIHYPTPIHFQEVAKDLGYPEGSLPVTENLSKRILSLPVYPEVGAENIRYIANCILEFYR